MTTQTTDVRESVGQLSEIKLPHLPLGKQGLKNVPAIPLDIPGMLDTLVKLGTKLKQREQALQGLSKTFTIGGTTAQAPGKAARRSSRHHLAEITMEGDANGAPHPEPSAYAKKFTGKYVHWIITGGIGHNLPQEAPQAFAEAIIELAEAG